MTLTDTRFEPLRFGSHDALGKLRQLGVGGGGWRGTEARNRSEGLTHPGFEQEPWSCQGLGEVRGCDSAGFQPSPLDSWLDIQPGAQRFRMRALRVELERVAPRVQAPHDGLQVSIRRPLIH